MRHMLQGHTCIERIQLVRSIQHYHMTIWEVFKIYIIYLKEGISKEGRVGC